MTHDNLPVRDGDPETSYAAALKAAVGASKVRPVVLDLVRELGPLTHDELIHAYNRRRVMTPDTPPASESGIRTRLKELTRAGFVEADSELGISNFNNAAKRWIAVDPDDYTDPAAYTGPDVDPESVEIDLHDAVYES